MVRKRYIVKTDSDEKHLKIFSSVLKSNIGLEEKRKRIEKELKKRVIQKEYGYGMLLCCLSIV